MTETLTDDEWERIRNGHGTEEDGTKAVTLLDAHAADRAALVAQLEALKARKTPDPCPLCDGSGVMPPADVSRDVLLCGACTAGRTEDCSGWCGRSAKPQAPTHAALVTQVAELTRERDEADTLAEDRHNETLAALARAETAESEVTRLTEALAAAERRSDQQTKVAFSYEESLQRAEARVRELGAENKRIGDACQSNYERIQALETLLAASEARAAQWQEDARRYQGDANVAQDRLAALRTAVQRATTEAKSHRYTPSLHAALEALRG